MSDDLTNLLSALKLLHSSKFGLRQLKTCFNKILFILHVSVFPNGHQDGIHGLNS